MDALAQIAGQLGLNNTFFYLFGLFVVLHLALSNLYLKPYQRLLERRKHSVEGVKKHAAEIAAKAEESIAAYREKLRSVTRQAQEQVRSREEQARKEEAMIIANASTKAKAHIQSTQEELDQQHQQAVQALSKDISGLAQEIAGKVLGRTS